MLELRELYLQVLAGRIQCSPQSLNGYCIFICRGWPKEPAWIRGAPSINRPGLDVSILEQYIQQDFQAGLSKSTQRSYLAAHRRYTTYCEQSGNCGYPSTQDTLCQFVSLLGLEGLKHKTIKCYLSGIRFHNIAQCFTDPFIKDMPHLHYVMRGIKSEEAKRQVPTKQHLPVTPAILLKVYSVLESDPSNFDNIMIWAASLVCFFGFLRSGEVTIPSATA